MTHFTMIGIWRFLVKGAKSRSLGRHYEYCTSFAPVGSTCRQLPDPNQSTPHVFFSTKNVVTSETGIHEDTYRILRKTSELGIDNSAVHEAVLCAPELTKYHPSLWVECLQKLINKGVPETRALQMIASYPDLLLLSPQKIDKVWAYWRAQVVEDDSIVKLVVNCPILLTCTKRDIRDKFPLLKAMVGGRKVVEVLLRNPEIMFQSLSNIEDLSNYLSVTMRIQKVSEVYKSKVMTCSLFHVKTRHTFLERCGKYIPPNPKHSEHIPTGNPTLSDIFDTTPDIFATKVAGLTLEEFVVFQDMFEMETKNNSETNSDSDSD